jgi:hypothetical protein
LSSKEFVYVPVKLRSLDLRFVIAAIVAMVVVMPSVARAQKERDDETIPKSAWPAPGLCRVWLKDVAPAQQPAPTDCSSAVRNPPSTATVLFGDMPGVIGRVKSGTAQVPSGNGRNSWSSRSADDPMRRNSFSRSASPAPSAQPTPVVTVAPAAPSAATATRAATATPVSPQPVVVRPADPPPAKPW